MTAEHPFRLGEPRKWESPGQEAARPDDGAACAHGAAPAAVG